MARIYIGNKEIAGYFTRLKEGFDKLGVEADLWFLIGSDYYNPPMNRIALFNQAVFNFYRRNRKPWLLHAMLPAAGLLLLTHTLVFLYALIRYDVFILNSQPFFTYHELAIMRLFRKKIIVVFLGTESRPPYLSGNSILGKYTSPKDILQLARCYRDTRAQYKRIALIEKFAHHIINHPPTALFQKKPFIAWLHVGFPNDENMMKPTKDQNKFSRIVKVLHAPSNSKAKGTAVIEEIITELLNEGLPIEYQRLENVPNEQIVNELSHCDLVVDELYSDIPIGGLGTEAAFARTAVINAGYYAQGICRDYPDELIPPACFCLPENLRNEIKNLVKNKPLRLEYANKLYDFVTSHWHNTDVAKKYMRIIKNQIPEEWMYKPEKLHYFKGYGISNEKLRTFMRSYVMHNGLSALFLDDKPELLAEIIEFITAKND